MKGPVDLGFLPNGPQVGAPVEIKAVQPLNDSQLVAVLAASLWKDAERRAADDAKSESASVEATASTAVAMACALVVEAVAQVVDNSVLTKAVTMRRAAAQAARDA